MMPVLTCHTFPAGPESPHLPFPRLYLCLFSPPGVLQPVVLWLVGQHEIVQTLQQSQLVGAVLVGDVVDVGDLETI